MAAKKASAAVRARKMASSDRGNITTPHAADLNAAARRYAQAQGWTMADGSYPIRPANMHGAADLEDAVHAIGRGNASSASIKAHIIKRAKAINAVSALPSTWNVKK